MIELRNRQYATVIDCVAGEALEEGVAVKLVANGNGLKALKATAANDFRVVGLMVAHWINPLEEAAAYNGAEDGLTFTLTPSSDVNSIHYIPSGARMLAVGGKGVAQIRFHKNSLNDDFASTLPNPGDVLGVSSADSKLCTSGAGDAIATVVAGLVTEKDAVSITVLCG
jgi:hypothetical protein